MEYVFLLLILGVAAWVIWLVKMKARELAEAKAAYQSSLAKLKQDPTNADVKQHTLALGRAYSNLTRNSQGVSLFDEVALSNDINAACAAASRHQPPTSPSPLMSSAASVESRLTRLADL